MLIVYIVFFFFFFFFYIFISFWVFWVYSIGIHVDSCVDLSKVIHLSQITPGVGSYSTTDISLKSYNSSQEITLPSQGFNVALGESQLIEELCNCDVLSVVFYSQQSSWAGNY